MKHEDVILAMLKKAGVRGINSYGEARRISLQLPYVIYKLKQKGHMIAARRETNRSVTYILLHSPTPAAQATTRPSEATPEYEWVYEDGVARQVVKGKAAAAQQAMFELS